MRSAQFYVRPSFGEDEAALDEASALHHIRQIKPVMDEAVPRRVPPFLVRGHARGSAALHRLHALTGFSLSRRALQVLNADRDLGLDVDGRRFAAALAGLTLAEHKLLPRHTHATITRSPETVSEAVAFLARVMSATDDGLGGPAATV